MLNSTKIKVISATNARKHWFEILNRVYFTGEAVTIEKNNIPLVKLMPVDTKRRLPAAEVIRRTHGFLKNKKTEWSSENLELSKKKWTYLESVWKK